MIRKDANGWHFGNDRIELCVGIVFVATAYLLFYIVDQNLPRGESIGWWGWWDQSQYLKSAKALANGNFDEAEHWYPLGYSMLGALFVKVWPAHAFLPVNLLSFVFIFMALVELGKRLGIGFAGGFLAFVVGILLPRALMQQFVIPWNTVPIAALYLWIFELHLRCTEEGITARRLSATALLFVAVVAIRPIDVLPVLPIALHLIAALIISGFSGKPFAAKVATRTACVALCATACGIIAYAGLHALIYGLKPSPYMAMSSNGIGLDWRSIPYKFLLIFSDPRPVYGDGTGIFEKYPLVVAGLWGLIYSAVFVRKARLVGATVIASICLYLAYSDFLPSNVWNFWLIHYLAWIFPVLTLLTLAALRTLLERRNVLAAALIAFPVALLPALSLNVDARPPGVRLTPDVGTLVLDADAATPVIGFRVSGEKRNGNERISPVFAVASADSKPLNSVGQYRVVERAGSAYFILNRPMAARHFVFPLSPGVETTPETRVFPLVPRIAFGGTRSFPHDETLDALPSWLDKLRYAYPSIGGGKTPLRGMACKGETKRAGEIPALDSEFIVMSYREVLGRDPDPVGLEDGCELLVQGKMTRQALLEAMQNSAEAQQRSTKQHEVRQND